MNHHPTGVGGLKEIIAMIHGKGAYSYLKFESGTHRVQRVPVTVLRAASGDAGRDLGQPPVQVRDHGPQHLGRALPGVVHAAPDRRGDPYQGPAGIPGQQAVGEDDRAFPLSQR